MKKSFLFGILFVLSFISGAQPTPGHSSKGMIGFLSSPFNCEFYLGGKLPSGFNSTYTKELTAALDSIASWGVPHHAAKEELKSLCKHKIDSKFRNQRVSNIAEAK